jgi:outer membrane protein assembly factor BamB
LTILALGLGASGVRANDWAYWRGPEQTGVSREKDLPAKVGLDTKDPASNLLWKSSHGGRSTPIVQGGRVYVNNQAGEGINEQERVMCFDANSGKVLWEKRFNVYHTDVVTVRLAWTNLVADPETGNVYYHGSAGEFVCFDRDGKILWQRQLTEQDGRITGYGGRVASPIVDGEVVIIGMINSSWGDQAKPSTRLLAMNKRTGVPFWWCDAGGPATYFSTPVVAVINGQRMLLTGTGGGAVAAINIYTGELLWSYPFCRGAVNCSPVVDGTKVYAVHGNDNLSNNILGGVVCLDAGQLEKVKSKEPGQPDQTRPKVVWRKDGVAAKYTSPLLHDGKLYVADDIAKLHCFNAATGEHLWRKSYGRNAMGSPVWADGKIYVANKNGTLQVLKPGDTDCEVLSKLDFPDEVEIYANPAVANGRIYFMTRNELFCFGKKDHTAKADPVPPLPEEPPLGPPARVQVYPADVTLHPGESTALYAHVLDRFGRRMRQWEGDGLWSLPAPPPPPKSKLTPPPLKGSFKGGQLTVDAAVPSQQGAVLCTTKMLGVSKARVRVAPRLPYALKLDKLPDGASPGGWVNAQGKLLVVTLKDGGKALRRVNASANPVMARGNAYIGLPGLTDYTIEADVMGTKVETGKESHMPDVGIVANRYTLALWGNLQRIRLTSWDAMPRVDEPADFPWKPGVWYRLKLTAEVHGDKVVARGKAWQRDQPEPKEWTVEVTDPTPNREGAPALYGYITGFVGDEPGNEIYYQNVRVYPNKKGEQTSRR